jgi:hypothetical protein
MERWRRKLARGIFPRNPQLSLRSLSYVVQATLDRMVFLRISKDRGTESPGVLRVAAGSQSVYRELICMFVTADKKYNFGLFRFSEERRRPERPTCYRLRFI